MQPHTCACCADAHRMKCRTCTHAIGVHCCERNPQVAQWKSGTLHNGKVDVDQSLWALARRSVPLTVITEKLDEYIAAGHLDAQDKEVRLRIFEEMVHIHRLRNPHANEQDAQPQSTDERHRPMSKEGAS